MGCHERGLTRVFSSFVLVAAALGCSGDPGVERMGGARPGPSGSAGDGDGSGGGGSTDFGQGPTQAGPGPTQQGPAMQPAMNPVTSSSLEPVSIEPTPTRRS
jgi:hypothetical protein